MKCLRILVLPVFLLGGCSLFVDRQSDSPVRLRDRLEIPPDLSKSSTEDLSSQSTASAVAKANAARPLSAPGAVGAGTLGVRPEGTSARLEREGTLRWLVVKAPPEQVWDILRDYLNRTRGGITTENLRLGYLETDWVEQRFNLGENALTRVLARMHSTGLRDKYRVRIEAGREPGTTEVMVSHLGLEEVVIGGNVVGPETIWQPRKTDPVLEADLLDRLLAALGAVDPTTRPLLTAEKQSVKRAPRPKGPLRLSGENSDSAWRKVSQALDRAGITIEDRDRGSGLLFVRFQEQSSNRQQSGLTTWLFGNRKTETDASSGRYQLRLKTDTNGVVVDVLTVEGEVDNTEPTAARLLDQLYEQLL